MANQIPTPKSAWPEDIREMHEHYGIRAIALAMGPDLLREHLLFRVRFLREELDEIELAIKEHDADGVVDGLIDLNVVSTGTLDLFDIDAIKAWDAVHVANMAKEVGIKASRPNPLGLPDLVKPEGWVAPSHKGNLGLIPLALMADD